MGLGAVELLNWEFGTEFCAAAARIEGRAESGKLLMGFCADVLSGIIPWVNRAIG